MKIIGLDVGEKRIGVARADSQTRIAIPVGYIVVDGSEWQKIAKMAQIHGTNWFVLGLPRSNEGNETKQSAYVRVKQQELMQLKKLLTEPAKTAKMQFSQPTDLFLQQTVFRRLFREE